MRRKKVEFRAGAAAYNNLARLIARKKQIENNMKRIGPYHQPMANELAAIANAARLANTNAKRMHFLRQANNLILRMEPTVRQLQALMTELPTINYRLEQRFVPIRYPHTSAFIASLIRMQRSRLAQAIENAYLRPGGMHTRKMMKNTAASKIQAAWRARRRP